MACIEGRCKEWLLVQDEKRKREALHCIGIYIDPSLAQLIYQRKTLRQVTCVLHDGIGLR